jgi:signal transduction histidine kinase
MKLIKKFVFYLSLVTVLIISPLILIIWHYQKELLFNQAKIQAETLFKMIVITRQWIAENRGRIEPVPAVATKELSVYADKMANFRFHITSDVLVNPANAPDTFEKKALENFKKGAKEFSEIIEYPKVGKVFRYMAPLHINESCMGCHYYQGYKIGDVRGGISVFIPLKSVEEAIILNNKMFYLFGFITFTSIILTVTILVNNLVLKHIKALADASNQIIGNNYNIQTNIRTGDEIEYLSIAFDKMVTTISKNEEILRTRLKEALDNYEKAYEELKEKNEKLLTVNKLKTDIIDTMAHDFRTPMTKILSYAEMLKDPKFKFNSEMIEKAIYVIYNNINIMKRSLDQILVLSKLEHAEQLQELYYYNLKHFVTNILLLFEKEIIDKHLKVYVNIDENIEIKADEDVLYHLFKNIISNAIKYNKDGGEISITATRNLDEIILEIYDSGIGIKDDEVEKIFNRFFRGSNAKSLQGTGLGMSIVYQSILKLNWDIKVESKEGVYTKVLIFIPIA